MEQTLLPRTVRVLLGLVLILGALAASARAQEARRVGILPFDVASVEGASSSAADSMAKLLRAQMIRNPKLRPVLLEAPQGAKLPLTPEQAAAAANGSQVDVVVAGTILEATESHSSNRASTFGRLPGSIGGSLSRTKASVSILVELLDPSSGQTRETFQVDASNTDTGVGADFSTVLGSIGVGDSGWEKTPMGKALREAADKIVAKLAKK